ncbi:MAG TPA: AAA family ATPase [Caldimonas sp.]|nr:AAA family ATPase [Caldimonas sp.]
MANTTTPPQATPPLKARFGRFEIDEAEARLLDDGTPVKLAPKPFAVLCALARTPQTLVTKSALLDHVWGHQYVSESVLKTTISDVRAVLDDDARQPRWIETVSCRGYRFIGQVTTAGQPAPLPQPIAGTGDADATGTPLIGRARELERLRRAWRTASGGLRQVAWVAGEAGVGKTALIERLVREVGESRVAHGHCVAHVADGEPGLPILEALTSLCRRDAAFVELMRRVAPTWLSRLPWLSTPAEREALQRELADSGQSRMLREMGELLDRYCADHPLLLVTEDLQWADQATVQLLDYLARRRSPARLLWLASFRLTEVIAADHPLATVRQELRLHGLGEEIVLDAFSPAEVAQYLAAHAPACPQQAAVAQALYERTDGLPLFVADVVNRALASHDGASSNSASTQQLAALAMPETLAGIVERYLEEVTPKQRAVLEAASVCGTRFRLSTLADVLQGDQALVATACAELARRQRWLSDAAVDDGASTEPTYAFRHALYREVLEKRLDAVARLELQRRLKASLDAQRPEPRPAPSIVAMARPRPSTPRIQRMRFDSVPMPA